MTVFAYGLSFAWLVLSTLSLVSALVWLRGVRQCLIDGCDRAPDILILLPARVDGGHQLALLRDCLDALRMQSYPGQWRAVVAFARQDDPGIAAVVEREDRRLQPIVADRIPDTAEKLSNLLGGYSRRLENEKIIVTLDADTVPQPTWLTDLTRPVRYGRARMSSGYRWMIPTGLPARLACLADRGPATTIRPRRLNLPWGGSTAILANLAEDLDLRSVWTGEVSDDLSLFRRARERSEFAWTPLHVLVPSPTTHTWTSLAEFARRQHVLLRALSPFHWSVLGICLFLPVAAIVAIAVATVSGNQIAWIVLPCAVILNQVRFSIRLKIGQHVLPEPMAAHMLRASLVDRMLLPIAHLVHTMLFLSNSTRRSFQWSGKVYRGG